uniref:Secreted protein n=1 Tax=Anopheles melas TaxID=34690 RepID=A0A182TIQ4_9DIPT
MTLSREHHHASLLLLVVIVGVASLVGVCDGQYYTTRDPRWYSREGDFNYKIPNPGDPEYRTYTFNNRRYGYYQPNGYGQQYPGQSLPGQYPSNTGLGDDRFKYDPCITSSQPFAIITTIGFVSLSTLR